VDTQTWVLQCPNLPVIDCAQSILMRDSQGCDSFTEDALLSAWDQLCCWPCPLQQQRSLLRRARNHRQQTLVHASQRLCLLDHNEDTCAKEHVLFWTVLTRGVVATTSHNKLHEWHADSSRRSIVPRSRESTTPRISSCTSLKHCTHFCFILKLAILICKQLKRPVAFSAVHCDIKPQIVT